MTADDRLELNSSTNVSGVVTLTANIDRSAELANGTFNKLQNVSFSGAGDSASLGVGTINVSGAALTMSLTGLAAGFSSTDVSMASANLVIDGSNTTGKMHMENVSGTEAVTISTGSLGWFSAGDIEGSNSIVIDMSAKALSSSGHLAVTDISSSGAVTVTLGASDLGASGRVALSSVTTESNFILDGTNFGGLIDVGGGSDVDVSANMTVTLGSSGHFSSEDTISVGQDFVLDASNAASANIQIGASSGKLSAGDSLTISLGQGSTAGLVSVVAIDGNTVTLDASNYGGNINITDTVTSGNYTVALGSLGDFSADTISAAAGNFTLDGSNSTTASITMNSITATGGNLTVSLGGGSGAVSGTSMFAGGKFTLDGTSFGGAVHITDVSASGITTISLAMFPHIVVRAYRPRKSDH